jgi:hypothetical protein
LGKSFNGFANGVTLRGNLCFGRNVSIASPANLVIHRPLHITTELASLSGFGRNAEAPYLSDHCLEMQFGSPPEVC